MDPIAEKFAHLSVYNYASNDPVSNVNLHGLQGVKYYIDKALKWLGFDFGAAGTNFAQPRTAKEANTIADRRTAVKETANRLEKVADVLETASPIPGTGAFRKAAEGGNTGEVLTELAIEGASELAGGSALTTVVKKVRKRVPKGEAWLKISDLGGGKDPQEGGTFIDEALDEANGYIKFGTENTESFKREPLKTGTLVPDQIREAPTGKRETWWSKLLQILDPPSDPGN